MFATGDFKRFEHEIQDRYQEFDIPITYGILIVDGEQSKAKEYIINYLNRIDKKSSSTFDFFIPGYVDYQISDSIPMGKLISRTDRSYYFNRELFDVFIYELEKKFNFRYTYNPILILAEKNPNQKVSSADKKIIIELDNSRGNVDRAGVLFENIFEIAKREVDLKEFSRELKTLYVHSGLIDTFIKLLGNKYITEINAMRNATRTFKIK